MELQGRQLRHWVLAMVLPKVHDGQASASGIMPLQLRLANIKLSRS